MNKLIWISSFLLALGFSLFITDIYFDQNRFNKADVIKKEAESIKSKNDLIQDFNKTTSIEDLLLLNKKLDTKGTKIKLAFFYLKEADLLLFKAKELQTNLNTDETPALSVKFIEQAIKYYEAGKNVIDNTEDSFDSLFLRGNLYYRYLMFLSTPQTAPEYFTQTLTYYKQALKYKNDSRVVVNIELLLKNKASAMSASNSSDPNKRIMTQVGRSFLRGN